MTDIMPGGWSGFDFSISKEAMDVFNKALTGFTGVKYTPYAVATQVVSGKNYCFICEGKIVYPGAVSTAYQLYIYAPLQGSPHITQIVEIKP